PCPTSCFRGANSSVATALSRSSAARRRGRRTSGVRLTTSARRGRADICCFVPRKGNAGYWSLQLDVSGSDYLGPPFGFLNDELTVLCGRKRKDRSTLIDKPCAHLLLTNDLIDRRIELVDDLHRRRLRRTQTEHGVHFIARYKFSDRRYVWQYIRARCAGDSESSQFARLD